MRTRRAPTGQAQHWADPLEAMAEPAAPEATRLDALVEALGLAVARRQTTSRPGSDS
jgi:hypothetical protein